MTTRGTCGEGAIDGPHHTKSVAYTIANRYGIAPKGHRLPPDTTVGAVRIQVSDLKRSLDYYQRVLGLHLMQGEDATAALGADRPLIVLRARPCAAPVPERSHLGLYQFAILLPTRVDLGGLLRHLSEVGELTAASDHSVSEAVYLQDPDGLAIEVYADRPRSSWETGGQELRMDSSPLDARDLLRIAEAAPWSGMPVGARIGHLHLSVSDLNRAATFYHQALGLDKIVWSYPGALFLSAGGYHHHLGLNTWVAGTPPVCDSDVKLLEWALELPDLESIAATARNLEAYGYPVARISEGEIVTRDPLGTRLRLCLQPTSRQVG